MTKSTIYDLPLRLLSRRFRSRMKIIRKAEIVGNAKPPDSGASPTSPCATRCPPRRCNPPKLGSRPRPPRQASPSLGQAGTLSALPTRQNVQKLLPQLLPERTKAFWNCRATAECSRVVVEPGRIHPQQNRKCGKMQCDSLTCEGRDSEAIEHDIPL